MSGLLKNLERLKNFDSHLKREKTGNAASFARKMNMSRSAFYDFLDEVKLLGAEIAYCAARKTYYYEKPWNFIIGNPSQEKTYGGYSTSIQPFWWVKSIFQPKNLFFLHCPEILDNQQIL
jgi:hypothetical protein